MSQNVVQKHVYIHIHVSQLNSETHINSCVLNTPRPI